jgi:polyhydroxybutyrate depolymerase
MGRTTAAAVLALAVLVAACSGGDAAGGGDSGDGGDDDRTGEPSGEESAAAEPGPGAAPAVPSPGCEAAGATAEADLAESTFEVRGEGRRYLLAAPAAEAGDDPLPLVLDFHGFAEGADVHAQMTQLGPFGVEHGFVTVFPHARGAPPAWDVNPDLDANNDLAYVEEVLDRVGDERCIDTARVYATGLSNGGMMASAVACALADRVAAVAPVSGLALPEGCEPSRPVPVLAFHGTADPILLFNGGARGIDLDGDDGAGATTTTEAVDLDGPGYPETVRGWAELDGCDPGSGSDDGVSDEVTRRTFDCPDEVAVEFLIVEGGGHSWPGSDFSRSIEAIVGPTTTDIDANAEAWEFFQRFALPPEG